VRERGIGKWAEGRLAAEWHRLCGTTTSIDVELCDGRSVEVRVNLSPLLTRLTETMASGVVRSAHSTHTTRRYKATHHHTCNSYGNDPCQTCDARRFLKLVISVRTNQLAIKPCRLFTAHAFGFSILGPGQWLCTKSDKRSPIKASRVTAGSFGFLTFTQCAELQKHRCRFGSKADSLRLPPW
jgi:hypothetical protein